MTTLSQILNQIEVQESNITSYQGKIDYYIQMGNNPTALQQIEYWTGVLKGAKAKLEEYKAMARTRTNDKHYNLKIFELYKSSFEHSGTTSIVEGDKFGIELEYEGEDLHVAPINYWTEHHENSLRPYNGHNPVEYSTSKPLDREHVTKALDYLKKKMAKSKPVESPRTSAHVHMNAQDLNWKQIVTWYVCYALLEDLLVEYSGPQRVGNLFCLRTRDTQYFLTCLEAALKNDGWELVTNPDLRYTSMNLASVKKFGTCEFRSMRSPIPFEMLETWIDILLEIKQASLKFDSPPKVLEYFEDKGPKAMLTKLLPTFYPMFNKHAHLHSWMWDAARQVKDVAYAVKWLKKGAKQDTKETSNENLANAGQPVSAPNEFWAQYSAAHYNSILQDIPGDTE